MTEKWKLRKQYFNFSRENCAELVSYVKQTCGWHVINYLGIEIMRLKDFEDILKPCK